MAFFKLAKTMLLACALLIGFSPIALADEGLTTVKETIEGSKNKGDSSDLPSKKAPALDDQQQVAGVPSYTFFDFVKIMLALGFVVVLLYLVLKFLNTRNLKYQQNQMVQNLGGVSVGAQKSVQLLQIGSKIYVIGVGEDVQLLKEITDEIEVDTLYKLYEDKQTLAAAPIKLKELFSKFNKTKVEEEAEQFNDLLQKRIHEIEKERSEGINNWKEKEKGDL
ncbi:MAG TPA: flagellar biosynthetic protein FliO [Metalysinibacillus jejuensis]|uniref:Flagellar biosynthetic protein FliO n=1 Tax=Metalysinibacillus jejuensis TaxID=914327 RepID=A0A921NCJ4_9BACL|nr:flagellar biosynthetic protein FliO [Metalysinibacillus jejuensis]HJH11662.1 flagellar biosynthetic protein FliO [Metalysinibacillus jejuensis]